ncbi:DUF188 domain-containing protein [Entomospira entomophila]|uniref:DUF188 domain-containing protein n=1 Tax=Entomospira entomophila TaxID=2719988 RepID=A0A968GB15_9SPIO|nr:DUF188 domain-containing protein [Entomospira entomophilus]NIZ40343.1 DUF188 domain-containing protein [Entomospira entomophilus]WDI35902.1 DUF188 domain-containing protein [Entomospira entomophilus]
MRVLIDGDSFVKQAREIVIRAAIKGVICAHFVANHPISLPKREKNIFFYQVEAGSDKADDFIVEHAHDKDLVLTRDIILASRLLEKNVRVLNDRGYEFTQDNIREKLSERLIMLRARESGLYVPPVDSVYHKKDLANFANRLYNIINDSQKGLRESLECVMINSY